ncbi:MAG TPA: hypothetical protein VLV83_01470 [Acidobacteriota bacterium]|nr:hypothetical protein [Acidobacteriota bacterium]
MTFVPVPVIVPHKRPSPEARELSQRLTSVIEEFQRGHPGLDASHVEQALEMTRGQVGKSCSASRKVLLLVGLALLVGGMAAVLYSKAPIATMTLPGMIAAVLVLAFLVMLIVRHGG